jgi:hypothetical protein
VISNMHDVGPRERVIYLSVALSLAVSRNEWKEARHLKKKLDESWRLNNQEREHESQKSAA